MGKKTYMEGKKQKGNPIKKLKVFPKMHTEYYDRSSNERHNFKKRKEK